MTASPLPDVPLAECVAWLQAARYVGRAYGNAHQEQIANTLLAHLRRLTSAPPDAVWIAIPRKHAVMFAEMFGHQAEREHQYAKNTISVIALKPDKEEELRIVAHEHLEVRDALRKAARQLGAASNVGRP